jgi:hypothetical protein
MKREIVIWTMAGFLVAGLWALYATSTFPSPLRSQGMVWTLINLTCPIVFVGRHFHFGVKLYWVLLANAATYGLFGLAAESLRQRFSHAR